MCGQILAGLLASAVVRLTGSAGDLVEGLHAFRLPSLVVYSLDHTFELLGGMRRPGEGRGKKSKPAHRQGFLAVLKQLLRGDVASFVQTIRVNIDLANEQLAQ